MLLNLGFGLVYISRFLFKSQVTGVLRTGWKPMIHGFMKLFIPGYIEFPLVKRNLQFRFLQSSNLQFVMPLPQKKEKSADFRLLFISKLQFKARFQVLCVPAGSR
ncbi:MAG: hypothetical protein ACOCQ6_00530 [Bacteroidota bacterium]